MNVYDYTKYLLLELEMDELKIFKNINTKIFEPIAIKTNNFNYWNDIILSFIYRWTEIDFGEFGFNIHFLIQSYLKNGNFKKFNYIHNNFLKLYDDIKMDAIKYVNEEDKNRNSKGLPHLDKNFKDSLIKREIEKRMYDPISKFFNNEIYPNYCPGHFWRYSPVNNKLKKIFSNSSYIYECFNNCKKCWNYFYKYQKLLNGNVFENTNKSISIYTPENYYLYFPFHYDHGF